MCSDHKLNLITKLNQELITALHMLSKSGCLVGFPCLAICCWITTLNNTYTHTIPDSPLRISKLPLFFTEKMRKKYVNLKSFRRLHRTKLQGGRIVQWQSACPKTRKSAVQVFTTASCCGGELFTYIHLASAAHISIMLLRPVKQGAKCTAETTNTYKLTYMLLNKSQVLERFHKPALLQRVF